MPTEAIAIPRSAALLGLQTSAESSNGLPNAQPATAAETPGRYDEEHEWDHTSSMENYGLHQTRTMRSPPHQIRELLRCVAIASGVWLLDAWLSLPPA